MKEVEIKILDINKDKVVQTLSKLNAKKMFDGDISTYFLDFKDGRIHKSKDALRLRKEGDVIELTFKKIKILESIKEAEEYSVHVSSLSETLKILQEIGLFVTQTMKKHRTSYLIGTARFDIDQYLDEYAFIPVFLEIEAAPDEIKKYSSLLGFQEKDCLPWSTDELVKHYCSK